MLCEEIFYLFYLITCACENGIGGNIIVKEESFNASLKSNNRMLDLFLSYNYLENMNSTKSNFI